MINGLKKVLAAKLHRLTVTAADLDYEGSLTLPPALLEASGIEQYEAINVWNVSNGSRFETYAITGQPDSWDVCVNGAAAHLATAGDIVIVASFIHLPSEQVQFHLPRAIFVDQNNKIIDQRSEIPGPLLSPLAQ